MKKTILLVDDDAEFAELFSGVLEYTLNLNVLTFLNPLQALTRAVSTPVDLVVTDTNMPEMNGIELLKALRLAKPSLPVVVLFSGLEGSSMTADEVLKMGALAVISKPEAMLAIADIIEAASGS